MTTTTTTTMMTTTRALLVLVVASTLAAGCATAAAAGSEVAADVSLPDTPLPAVGSEAHHALADYRGRVVLLDVWATWCEPCLEALPVYDGWQRELDGEGLTVLAVSVDTDDASVIDFVGRHDLALTVLRDPEGTWPARLQAPTMPTAYLIGRDGRVRSRHPGFRRSDVRALRAQIEAALAAPGPGGS